jgi:hypothetical protein
VRLLQRDNRCSRDEGGDADAILRCQVMRERLLGETVDIARDEVRDCAIDDLGLTACVISVRVKQSDNLH